MVTEKEAPLKEIEVQGMWREDEDEKAQMSRPLSMVSHVHGFCLIISVVVVVVVVVLYDILHIP